MQGLGGAIVLRVNMRIFCWVANFDSTDVSFPENMHVFCMSPSTTLAASQLCILLCEKPTTFAFLAIFSRVDGQKPAGLMNLILEHQGSPGGVPVDHWMPKIVIQVSKNEPPGPQNDTWEYWKVIQTRIPNAFKQLSAACWQGAGGRGEALGYISYIMNILYVTYYIL